MTSSIGQILTIKYPDDMLNGNIMLQDDGDGAYIAYWAVPNIETPTVAEVLSWDTSPDIVFAKNKIANEIIYEQLDVLDAKTIRPLREGDTARLATLNTQAAALRAKLLPTS